MPRIRVCSLAVASLFLATTFGANSEALIVEPTPTQTLVLATARARATTPARDVTITVAADSRAARTLLQRLPRYDAKTLWVRSDFKRVTLGRVEPRFILTVLRPDPAKFAAYLERLATLFLRDGDGERVWSVVARARDCALLDARALDFARESATRDAFELARAAALERGAAVASENVTRSDSLDREASTRRCALGSPRIPARPTTSVAASDAQARVTSDARIAIAFTTTPAPARNEAMDDLAASDVATSSAPPLYDAVDTDTRVRVSYERVGPTLAVVGTSARMRPPSIVRYDWTSSQSGTNARMVLRAVEAARRRLLALGVARAAIVTRVRWSPLASIDLFVDVPAAAHISGDAIAAAIGGADARARASVGETLVRARCNDFDARSARESIASARERAEDLARALDATLGFPVAFASRGVVAPLCANLDTYAPAMPRGIVVGGPQRLPALATYASALGAYTLRVLRPKHAAKRARTAPNASEPVPESYFATTTRMRTEPDIEIAVARESPAFRVMGIGTARIPAESAELNIAISADSTSAGARIDPLAAYALAAPLERIAARAPTRVVVSRGEPAHATRVALHLDLRAPLGPRAIARLQALIEGARRLGRTDVQFVFATSNVNHGEALARRAALHDAEIAASREARARGLRATTLAGIVEAEPYIEHRSVPDALPLDQRVAIVVRLDETYVASKMPR